MGEEEAIRAEVCGVVVTFHPDDAALENLRTLVAECGQVIVVDNGSSAVVQVAMAAVVGLEILPLRENRGVAAALNLGLSRAMALGFSWAITFDQDSRPRPGFLRGLWTAHERHPKAALVAPRIAEKGDDVGYRWVRARPHLGWIYQRVKVEAEDLSSVTLAITSGSMLELVVWQALGGFDDGLFIDYVDIDYCLKVVRSGRTIVVAATSILDHQLGARGSGKFLGHDFRPMNHAAFRHYYMARNRVWTWRRHAWAVPHWAMFDVVFAGYNLGRVMVWEKDRLAKLRELLCGTWHGLRGRKGPR